MMRNLRRTPCRRPPPRALFQLALWAGMSLALGGCDRAATSSHWSGYAEGDYVYVAAALPGRLDSVPVQIGHTVAKGDALFQLDAESEQAARDEAAARLEGAKAQVSDLEKGRRHDEISVIQAQQRQAQTSIAQARQELQRQQKLVAQGFVSQAHMDDANTALRLALAKADELAAALRVAQLPARADQRTAMAASAMAAQEVLRQSVWRAGQKQQAAPVSGLVTEVFYQPGEWIAAGQPVVALLPAANIKARFYVPEAELASIQLGQAVSLHCDGCKQAIAAQVSRIATQPEFTPPVIYSNTQRTKLVFMVEAKPDAADAGQLKPGQPLVVTRPTPVDAQ
jgi:HlyD family secretion protein